MANTSDIEWTHATWNPVTGCNKISLGCQNCYAQRMAKHLQAIGAPHYENGFEVTPHEDSLQIPFRWKRPRLIFANSMSDLFHKEVPKEFILKIFEVMRRANWHKYQILTKRPERLLELDKDLPWAANILMGVTVESAAYKYRIDLLRKCGAKTKFLSLEPLLSDIPNLDLRGIDWVILGGESGPNARPMEESWVLSVKEQCLAQKIPFFFKQWGGVNKKTAGRLLQGQLYEEYPAILKPDSLF